MILLDTLPDTLRGDYALVYEARVVHDTATLRLSDYHADGGSNWIIATLSPAPGSGSATVPGAYLEAETGRFVNPAQNDALLLKKGTWQALAAGDSTLPGKGEYEWTEPLAQTTRVVLPEDYYSPFAHGGTIVFQWQPDAAGAQRFANSRLLFAEWARAAADSLKTSAHINALLGKLAAQPQTAAEAVQMSRGSNGISATLAFGGLLQQTPGFALQAPTLLRAADARRLSIFVYLGLTAAPAKNRAEWLGLLHHYVMETREPERLLAIAYAAFAAQLFASQDPGSTHAARELMQALHKRVGELGIPIPENSPWTLLFRKSGIG